MSTRKSYAKRKPKKDKLVALATAGSQLRYTGGLQVVKNPNPTWIMKIPIASQLISSTATPTIAQVSNVTIAMINNFTTRWGTVFREYLITGAEIRLTAVGGNAGTAVAWVDELNATTPTAATAGTADHVQMSLTVGDKSSTCLLKWRVAEVNDMGWTATTSTVPAPCSIKVFSDTPNYGLAQASTAMMTLDGYLLVILRGLV